MRCKNCDYSLQGLTGLRCPECGWESSRPLPSRVTFGTLLVIGLCGVVLSLAVVLMDVVSGRIRMHEVEAVMELVAVFGMSSLMFTLLALGLYKWFRIEPLTFRLYAAVLCAAPLWLLLLLAIAALTSKKVY